MTSKTHPMPGRPAKNPQTPGTSPRQVRPPFDGRTPLPGVSDDANIRRTAQKRQQITPRIVESSDGFPLTHAYVRRYWVAAIGPGAVADLLRLAAAAQSGRSLRTPIHLPMLLREGLATRHGDVVTVKSLVPGLPDSLLRRLTPRLRGELIAETRGRQAV